MTDPTGLASGWIDFRLSIETEELDLQSAKNTKKRPDFRAAFSIQLQKLDLRMDQTPRLIAEKHVDLVRFDDGRDFAATKLVVRHRLALAVFSHPVVGRRVPTAAHVNRGFDASCECADRLASFARGFGELTLFGNGLDNMVLLQIARRTHHLDQITDCKYFFFHNWPCYFLTSATRSE